jgi:hypothetical protein
MPDAPTLVLFSLVAIKLVQRRSSAGISLTLGAATALSGSRASAR